MSDLKLPETVGETPRDRPRCTGGLGGPKCYSMSRVSPRELGRGSALRRRSRLFLTPMLRAEIQCSSLSTPCLVRERSSA